MNTFRLSSEQSVNYRRCLTAAAAATVAFAAAALAPAAAASALPTGGGSAADTVQELEARGYNVQVNANTTAPLSLSGCAVTDVHGLTDSNVDHAGHLIDPAQFTTAFVSVFCRPQG